MQFSKPWWDARATPRLFVLFTLLVPGWLGCERKPEQPALNKINVVLVTLDTTRADHLGCYEPRRAGVTPNFDRLAAEGVQFVHCVSAAAATPVSHASILTGLYPYQHGLRVIYAKSGCQLPDDVPYLPELLQRAGWKTAAFLSSFTVSEFYGLQRGFGVFDSGLTRGARGFVPWGPHGVYDWNVVDNQRRSDHTTDAALAWLDQAQAGTPFFLWVHYWDPHDWTPTAAETAPPPEFSERFLRQAGNSRRRAKLLMYEAEVAFVDMQFGRLIEKLKARGLYENTLVLVIADHGEGLGDHDWPGHRLLYQEQIWLPLLVRGPGWRAGRRVDAVARSIDVFPTVLEAIGLAVPRPVTGESLKALLERPDGPPRLAYAEALNKFDLNTTIQLSRPKDGNLYCLTDGSWKLIWRLDYPDDSELYDLAQDPRELRNRLSEAPAEATRLRRALDGLNAYRAEPFPDLNPIDRSVIESLKGLGYVGSPDDEGEPAQATTQPTSASRPVDEPG